MASTAIAEHDFPLIRALRLMGKSWAGISIATGYAKSTLHDNESDIMDGSTVGDKLKVSEYGENGIVVLAHRTDDDRTKLSALKVLAGSDDTDDTTEVDDSGSNDDIKQAILDELNE